MAASDASAIVRRWSIPSLKGLSEWSSVDKCLLMGVLHLWSRTSLTLVFRRFTNHPDQYPYMDPVWTERFFWVFLVLLCFWAVMVATGIMLRHRIEEPLIYVHLTIQMYWLTVGVMSWGWGLMTGPFWMAALGSAVLSLILWGPRRTYQGVAATAVFVVVAVTVERLGLVRYAPLLLRSPVDESGMLDLQFLSVMGSANLSGFALTLYFGHKVVGEWRDRTGEMERLSNTDLLTGLHNRRWFRQACLRELELARRHHTAVALLFLDVDHFKMANDRYGHHAGDAALGAVALQLRACLRGHDLLARYGGEEFACLLPHTGLGGGEVVAERCREAVQATQICVDGKSFSVTVTVGVAAFSADGVGDLDALIRAADEAMYRGKDQGRNRTVLNSAS